MSNKELVKKAITEIFVNKDMTAIDRYFDENYIQHNPRFPSGTEGLKAVIKNLKTEIKYESSLVVEEGEFVMIHGRYEGWGPKPVIAVDVFKVKNGKLVEHWDILQEEVPMDKSANGNAMFPIK
jgi:predicted SnoaL-like aldol condensation-catalyzing enzyme